MNVLKGIIGSLCIAISAFMLYSLLMNGFTSAISGRERNFIGVSDIYYYVSNINLLNAWNEFADYIAQIVNKFYDFTNSFGNVTDFGSFFSAIGSFFSFLGQALGTPFYFFISFLKFLWDLISTAFNFIGFVSGF